MIVLVTERPDLVRHLGTYVKGDQLALPFTGELDRNPLRQPNYSQWVKWATVIAAMGVEALALPRSWLRREHDESWLRREHDDMRAGSIYQRATSDADRMIADRLSKLVDEHRSKPDD